MMKTKSIIEQSIELKREIAENSALLERVEKAAETISGAFRKGHRVFFCDGFTSIARLLRRKRCM